jgi:hypothetical protein
VPGAKFAGRAAPIWVLVKFKTVNTWLPNETSGMPETGCSDLPAMVRAVRLEFAAALNTVVWP